MRIRTLLWALPGIMVILAGCSKRNPEPVAQDPAASATQAVSARQALPAAPAQAPADVRADAQPTASADAEDRADISIPRGSKLRVRVDEPLNTRRNRAGDAFHATLTDPVEVEGRTVLPAGTVFTGHVTTADESGRLEGRAVLGITLDSFRREGAEYRIQTDRVVRESASHAKRNVGFIGGGAGLGAVIGAIAGSGKGAAVGALAGGAAGTAGAAATGKMEVGLPAEALLTFSLAAPVTL
jgi:hypothetical protein